MISKKFKDLGFKKDPVDNLRWNKEHNNAELRIYFEGYAYVLYIVEIKKEYKSEKEIPLMEFKTYQDLKTIIQLIEQRV